MEPMSHGAATAARTYLVVLGAGRRLRAVLVALVLLALVPGLAGSSGHEMEHQLLVPGASLAALLLAELPIRDGLSHRTLLYPLLGPVSRATLAWVRLLMTWLVSAAAVAAVVLAASLVGGGQGAHLLRRLLAVLLATFAYTGLFSLLHLLTRRGTVGGLLFIFLLDLPLGSFPVAIRFLAPSAHVRTLAAISAKVSLPLPMAVPEGTLLVSALTLLVLGLASAWLSVWIFRNRDLGALA